jgi:hypothetical protein
MITKTQKQAIIKLKELAKALGFKVKIVATKEMREYFLAGIMCPETKTIYVNPEQDQVVESLGHELGHVIAMFMKLEDLDEEIQERIADRVAIALLKVMGYPPKEDAEDKLTPVVVGEIECQKP